MKILVTGAGGLVGGALLRHVVAQGHAAAALPRPVFEQGASPELARRLAGADVLIHCAALTPRRDATVTERTYEQANSALTRRIAEAAARAGVPRFVFVSSISAVSGQAGALHPDSPIMPADPYGRSKANAEAQLRAMSGGMRRLVLRPPLVYGPGVKGDFASLLRLCTSPLPLPFGLAGNRRAMVALTNLVDALTFMATSDAFAEPFGIHHISDEETLTFREIVARIRGAMDRPARLLPVPPRLLTHALALIGRGDQAGRLFAEVLVDDATLRAKGWRPVPGAQADLAAMARAFVRGA